MRTGQRDTDIATYAGYECPVDLREKTIQVRYDRMRCDRLVVYFANQRMGEATPLDLHANARLRMPEIRGAQP